MQHEVVCDFVTNGLTTVAYDLRIDLDLNSLTAAADLYLRKYYCNTVTGGPG